MEKEFIPYEEALALKKLGFDELCGHEYSLSYEKKKIKLQYWEDGTTNTEIEKLTDEVNDEQKEMCLKPIDPTFTAPLYQQAFRWLYQKLSIENGIMPLNTEFQQLLLKELIALLPPTTSTFPNINLVSG